MTPSSLSGIWTFFLSRIRVACLLIFIFTAWGLVGYHSIPRESTPDVEIPVVVVTTVWPGASPLDIERLITDPIERQIASVEKISRYESSSKNTFSVISIEFESGSDMDKNLQNIKEKVDIAKPDLPSDLPDEPTVIKANISAIPVLTLALGGDLGLSELRRITEALEGDLKNIEGVKEVNILGVPEEEIHIYLNPTALEVYKISADTVINVLRSAHAEIPLGDLSIEGETVEVRLNAKLDSAKKLLETPIQFSEGKTVFLRDISTVMDEYAEKEVDTLFSTGKNAVPIIQINITKSDVKTDITRIVEEAYALLQKKYDDGTIPSSVSIKPIWDGATDVRKSLDNLVGNGMQTVVLVFLSLLIFLGPREAVLSLMALPIIVLISIGILYAIGESFNFLSLFALILTVGMLVDNTIVMTEGISENVFSKKMSVINGITQALVDFRYPLIVGTLTTVAAFVPMAFFIGGVSGQFIRVIPVAASIVMTVSIIVSLFILPVLAMLFFRLFPSKTGHDARIFEVFRKFYERTAAKIFPSKIKRHISMIVVVLLMLFSLALIPLGLLKIEVFPAGDYDYFTLTVENPKGTSRKETERLIPILESIVQPKMKSNSDDGEITQYTITVGQRSVYDPEVQNGLDNSPSDEVLGLKIDLTSQYDRKKSAENIADEIEAVVQKKLPKNAELIMGTIDPGPPGGSSPVEVRLSAKNYEHLQSKVQTMREKMEHIQLSSGARLKAVSDNLGEKTPQITWDISTEKLSRYQLSSAQIIGTLRTALTGSTVFNINRDGDEVAVKARIDFDHAREWTTPEGLDRLAEIPIITPIGSVVRLGDVAEVNLTNSNSVIRHRDGKRSVVISAKIDGRATAKEFDNALQQAYETLTKLPGDEFKIGGDSEESVRLVKEMGIAMMVGLAFIFILLVWQFDSFVQAVVITLTVPLSLMVVFYGFTFSGISVGFPTMIGIVALAGIIVNNSILFIDRYNYHFQSGMERFASIVLAGKERLQPITLTSMTTVLGLLPLLLSDPIWKWVSATIIYGVSVSVVITLFVIPIFLISAELFFEKQLQKFTKS